MDRLRAAGFFLMVSSALCACEVDNSVSPSPTETAGPWILDTTATIDEFLYRADACAEVFPAGSVSSDTLPAGSAVSIRITTTACYALTVRVVNADSDTVRTFSTRFTIFNRSEGEKNRGVSSYVAWDGKDDSGNDLGPGRYLWHMDFDFGLGRLRRFRADILVP